MNVTKEVLTTAEAAVYLGLSQSSVRTMTCNRALPHYKSQNGKVYFKLDELRAFALAVRVPTKKEVKSKAEVRSLEK